MNPLASIAALCLSAVLALAAHAQSVQVNGSGNTVVVGAPATVAAAQAPAALATHVIVPQARSFNTSGSAEQLGVSGVRAHIEILQQVATVDLSIDLSNPTDRVQEAELVLPVPEGAAVRGFDFQGAGKEPSARLLPKDEARGTYNAIVSKVKDPALLEFAGYRLIRSCVFPVPAHGTQKLRIVYEHVCGGEGDRVDFRLPRAEALSPLLVPWKIDGWIKSGKDIGSLYSPSHEIEVVRNHAREFVFQLKGDVQPGPFQLSWLLQGDGINATLYSCPEAGASGGHFLLLAAAPPLPSERRQARELVLVIDRSGSMAGEKWAQAVKASEQLIDSLADGERFALLDYSDNVGLFSPAPLPLDAALRASAKSYLAQLRPVGGTNIAGALKTALALPSAEGCLPLVLFLTDGLPTVGETRELELREEVLAANAHERRVFTFGVGHDVNAPLLDALARRTRASSAYVQPAEAVDAVVAQLAARLRGPVMSNPVLEVLDAQGQPAPDLVAELVPGAIGDFYAGDQLLVLGRYRAAKDVRFRLTGNYLGGQRSFDFQFSFARSSAANHFVPRLWATRRVAELVDLVRQAGASAPTPAAGAAQAKNPATQELVASIVELSTRYGVLTEYTSFLALEGTDLAQHEAVLARVNLNLLDRAQRVRAGRAAVNQAVNTNRQLAQSHLNRLNKFLDPAMQSVQFTSVQQVGARTFFLRKETWIDSRLVARGDKLAIDRTIDFGGNDHRALLDALAGAGEQGALSLRGHILIEHEGKAILVRRPLPGTASGGATPAAAATPAPQHA